MLSIFLFFPMFSAQTRLFLNKKQKKYTCRGNYCVWKLQIIQIVPEYFNFLPNELNFYCGNYSREETIQGRKLFKGGNYSRKYVIQIIYYLPWYGICGPCFVHNVRCNGQDVLDSIQIHTLCVLAHLRTESSHRAVFHSLDLTGLLHIDRQVRHGRYPVVKVSFLGVHSLLGDLHICSGRLGILVVNLCYFAVFVDFLQQK